MIGYITSRHLIKNAATLLLNYGPRVYYRCWMSVARREYKTFLQILVEANFL